MIGFVDLLKHKKSTFCLITLACATTGLLMGKLDGTSYAAVIGSICSVYMYVQHKLDLQSNLPPRGQ